MGVELDSQLALTPAVDGRMSAGTAAAPQHPLLKKNQPGLCFPQGPSPRCGGSSPSRLSSQGASSQTKHLPSLHYLIQYLTNTPSLYCHRSCLHFVPEAPGVSQRLRFAAGSQELSWQLLCRWRERRVWATSHPARPLTAAQAWKEEHVFIIPTAARYKSGRVGQSPRRHGERTILRPRERGELLRRRRRAGGGARLRARRACRGCACGTRRSPRPPAPAAQPPEPPGPGRGPTAPSRAPRPAPAPRPPHLPVHVVLEAVLGRGVPPDGQLQDAPWKEAGRAVGRGPRGMQAACGWSTQGGKRSPGTHPSVPPPGMIPPAMDRRAWMPLFQLQAGSALPSPCSPPAYPQWPPQQMPSAETPQCQPPGTLPGCWVSASGMHR